MLLRAADGAPRFDGRAAVAEEQLGFAEAADDQLFQAQGRWRQAAGKFRHEGDARFFHLLFDEIRFRRIGDIEGRPAVDRFAVLAGRQNRQRAVPLRRENQHRIDIGPGTESPKTVHGLHMKVASRLIRQVGHFTADAADLEPVGKGSKRRAVAIFPGFTETDDANTKLHWKISPQGDDGAEL